MENHIINKPIVTSVTPVLVEARWRLIAAKMFFATGVMSFILATIIAFVRFSYGSY